MRVTFSPQRAAVLHTSSGDSLPATVRVLEGRVRTVKGDTLEIVLVNARDIEGRYLRPAATGMTTRVVVDGTARVDVRYIGAVRTIVLVGIPTLAYVWLYKAFEGW